MKSTRFQSTKKGVLIKKIAEKNTVFESLI